MRAAELLPLVPAAAIPLLFLHRRYQAHTSFGPVDVFGSDIAVAATVAAALVAGAWWGFAPLRRPRTLWALAGALLALYAASCFWTPLDHTTKHLITAAKIGEYALLAPAIVLLLGAARRRRPLPARLRRLERGRERLGPASVPRARERVLRQTARPARGVVPRHPRLRRASRRAALAIGLAGIALGERRRIVAVAAVAGAVGSILAASVFAFSGIVLAVILAAEVGRRAGTLTVRRGLALAGITLAVGGGVFELRAGDVTNFLSFLGHAKPTAAQSGDIQTGAHRVVLAYIGLRIWEDHPLLGVGFERSTTHYGPYVAAAKRKYPHEAPSSFPSPQHAWGVQNLWVQTLADVGIVGLVLLLGTFGAALALALRALRHARLLALIAAGWILVAAGTWNAIGILAGIPLDALTWLGFGLAAAVGGLE